MNQHLALRIRTGEPQDYPELVTIWRSAVTATHDFLAESHRAQIEAALPAAYFPAVELTVAELAGTPVGFCGVSGSNLEMLFVRAEQFGGGVGSALLAHAIAHHGIDAVDVNEQNRQALDFYRARGFQVIGRSPVDAAGWPYPLLHLRLKKPSE